MQEVCSNATLPEWPFFPSAMSLAVDSWRLRSGGLIGDEGRTTR